MHDTRPLSISTSFVYTVEPLLWGHPFCPRIVTFQVRWPLNRGLTVYTKELMLSCLDLLERVTSPEGLASRLDCLSRGFPLYIMRLLIFPKFLFFKWLFDLGWSFISYKKIIHVYRISNLIVQSVISLFCVIKIRKIGVFLSVYSNQADYSSFSHNQLQESFFGRHTSMI